MDKYKNVNLIYNKLESVSDLFNSFLLTDKANSVDKEDKDFIIEKIDIYFRELLFIKSSVHLSENKCTESDFKIVLLEINNFINGLNDLIKS